jgi:hypothetical protein
MIKGRNALKQNALNTTKITSTTIGKTITKREDSQYLHHHDSVKVLFGKIEL